jgi:hypothetical protein
LTLGNSLSFGAYIENKKHKRRHGIEHVLNPEEYGVYVTGFTEKWISDLLNSYPGSTKIITCSYKKDPGSIPSTFESIHFLIKVASRF